MIRDHFCDGLDPDPRYPVCICCCAFSFLSADQAGEWDGMVAELVNKKADIALGSLRFF